uniref:Uncharacterized protein n=1 Tax=Parascaris equorum TaxID=6256 RepID=A0A914SA42_PAREQ
MKVFKLEQIKVLKKNTASNYIAITLFVHTMLENPLKDAYINEIISQYLSDIIIHIMEKKNLRIREKNKDKFYLPKNAVEQLCAILSIKLIIRAHQDFTGCRTSRPSPMIQCFVGLFYHIYLKIDVDKRTDAMCSFEFDRRINSSSMEQMVAVSHNGINNNLIESRIQCIRRFKIFITNIGSRIFSTSNAEKTNILNKGLRLK